MKKYSFPIFITIVIAVVIFLALCFWVSFEAACMVFFALGVIAFLGLVFAGVYLCIMAMMGDPLE